MLVDFRQTKMMELEMVRRSSRIQGTEEGRRVRLELREIGGSSLRLREHSVSASRLLQVVRDGAWRPHNGTEGDRPFQAETVGAGRLQAGMEGVRRSMLRRREPSISRPKLRKLVFPRL